MQPSQLIKKKNHRSDDTPLGTGSQGGGLKWATAWEQVSLISPICRRDKEMTVKCFPLNSFKL